MCTILLSIHPKYVEKIMKNEKTFEYRTRIPNRKVDKIIIYATSPKQKVLCEVNVKNIIDSSPELLWEKTSLSGGITKEDFFKYFKNRIKAYAYDIEVNKIFDKGKDLIDYGVTTAPQSYRYLD